MSSTTSKPQLRITTTPPSPTIYTHLLYVSPSKRSSLMAVNVPASCSSSTHSTSSSRSHHSTSSHTTPSIRSGTISPKYADEHYPLITTLNLPNPIPQSHPSAKLAHRIAQINNSLIRALSSSYNHCLSVSPCTTTATDFLVFNSAIATAIQHQLTSTALLFRAVKRLTSLPKSHSPTTLQKPFTEALTLFTKYATTTSSAEYSGLTLRHIIDSFAPALIQHFHDQIPAVVATHLATDQSTLPEIFKSSTELTYDPYTSAPLFQGCHDRQFKIDGLAPGFPGSSWAMATLVKTWYGRRHRAAWRFLPCDFDGRRRRMMLEW